MMIFDRDKPNIFHKPASPIMRKKPVICEFCGRKKGLKNLKRSMIVSVSNRSLIITTNLLICYVCKKRYKLK